MKWERLNIKWKRRGGRGCGGCRRPTCSGGCGGAAANKNKKCAHRQTQVCCAPQSYNHSLCAFLNSIRCGVRRSGPAAKHSRMILILVLLPAPLVTFTLSKLKLSTTESDRGVLGYINVTNSQCSFIWVCPANLSMKSCQSVCQLEVRASEQIRDENTVSS